MMNYRGSKLVSENYARWIVTLILGVALFTPAPSHAVNRFCRWSIAEVPVYINSASFETRGYTLNEIVGAVSNAIQAWNTEAESNFRFYLAGYSTLENAAPGTVLVEAERGGFNCGLAGGSFYTPDCFASTISVFDRTADGCFPSSVSLNSDAPDAYASALSSILVHEFGHATGFGEDYANPVTVMQAAGFLNSGSLHLYNVDIGLMQNGDPSNGVSGYGRRANPIYGVESSDGVTWTSIPGGPFGSTAYRPAIAASASHKVLAFVDTTPPLLNGIYTRRYSGGVWSAPSSLGVGSLTGVALAYGGGQYLIAYTAPSDTRDLKVRTSLDGLAWSGEISVGGSAGSQSAPGLTYNAGQGRFNLFWTDLGTDRVRFSTSTNGAIWTGPAEVGSGREFFALDGPAAACGATDCLLLWPSWNSYGGIGMPLCTLKFVGNGATLSFTDMNCQTIDSARSPGLAHKPATGRFVVARAGRDSNNTLSTSYKTFQTISGWSAPVSLPWQNATGVDATYNPASDKFEAYFADR